MLLAGTQLFAAPKPAVPEPLTFEKDIRPILKANCFHCHGEGEKLKGGLDVRLKHLIAKGGEHGTAITPGSPEKSRLFTMIRDGEMPKSEKKLSPAQVETIRQWIAGDFRGPDVDKLRRGEGRAHGACPARGGGRVYAGGARALGVSAGAETCRAADAQGSD